MPADGPMRPGWEQRRATIAAGEAAKRFTQDMLPASGPIFPDAPIDEYGVTRPIGGRARADEIEQTIARLNPGDQVVTADVLQRMRDELRAAHHRGDVLAGALQVMADRLWGVNAGWRLRAAIGSFAFNRLERRR